MGKILCATRGGEASYRTQDQAIALARQRGDSLIFLYVIDTHFLDKTAAPIVVDVGNQLQNMGGFLLAMAQERAEGEGVPVQCICRPGRVRDEIKAVAREEKVDLVVLGRPAGEANAFAMEELRAFATEIEAETGSQVEIV
ncbi:MAG: universal stress protein [Anaerolineales bacterium]|nr:MAG: universal stress protein [Anaerolineales bacterium]